MATENKTKEKILAILMDNSRKSLRTIARELNISTTTVSRIVKEFEDSGVIQGYSTLIDWRKMGYDSTLCLQVSVTPEADIERVGKGLKALPALKQVFYTTGDTTFSAYAVCKNTEDAAELLVKLRGIPGIERIVPHTVLKIF
ncbi:Lrp/AsnC family transcriptional regulator [[Eubacterium] cellulosolvens]